MEFQELFLRSLQVMRHGYTIMIQKQSECQRSGLKKMPHLQPKCGGLDLLGNKCGRFFFRSSGFVEAVPLEDRKTVTADWYTTVCLPKLITAIESQREKTGIRGILLHHDNAPSHTAIRTRELLENSGLKTLHHPPYSPDLAPCNFWLFPTLKDQLRGRRFRLMRS
ncbi:Histone-lysine N-methyltransferase SETMAR-like [Oopsacas minuta]|uniref:Histone-lysine N-methyltransferase SETMAR-like n=1 Tax=Oopsacas minuta TaxID=111878 RepID=A0AAV7KD89_9METZ|nr:Histone-lysine N-methyltransferase SETMAR-like [Oopsacas minuta]